METKICRKCSEQKLLLNFSNDKKTKDGKWTVCKKCSYTQSNKWRNNNKDKYNKGQRERRQKNKKERLTTDKFYKNSISTKNTRYKREYGITYEWFQNRIKEIQNKCEICQKENKVLVPDHCHKTGKYRGALCHSCNVAIGLLKDDCNLLNNAIFYLQKQDKECF